LDFSLVIEGAQRLHVDSAVARMVDGIFDRRIYKFDGAAAERSAALAAENNGSWAIRSSGDA
jgi:hypothetical protein